MGLSVPYCSSLLVSLSTFSLWIFYSWLRRLIPERFFGVEWQNREFANLTRRVQLIYSRALIEIVARRRKGHFVGMPFDKSFLDLQPENIEENAKLCKPNKCLWLIPSATWIMTQTYCLHEHSVASFRTGGRPADSHDKQPDLLHVLVNAAPRGKEPLPKVRTEPTEPCLPLLPVSERRAQLD